jgi:cytochrome P450
MLLGIPEEDQEAIRDRSNETMRTEAGKPMKITQDGIDTGEIFAHYIDWRAENPSDDIMTELLNVEFEDETATTRRLSRDELLLYVNVVAGAGNETTTRLIGWAGKVWPSIDQRRAANDKSLIPRAIQELLRYEPPATCRAVHQSRRRVLRPDGAGGQRHVDAGRRRQPRSSSIPA